MNASTENREPRFSITISTYRRAAGLARLLEALRPQVAKHAAREVVVVNDGSHDATYENIVRGCADIAGYHALPENIGIARARNAVAARARGAYLVFTDDDCVPPSFWLDWLEARLDADPEIDVLIGTTQPRLPDRPRFFERVNGHYTLIPTPHGTPTMPLFVTANVAIRRELFERVGRFGFVQAFPAGEDTELASRLSAAGARIVVDPHWFVHHDVSDGLIRQMRRYWRYGYANVRMCELTTAPGLNVRLAHARRRYHVANAIEQLRANLETAKGFSRWALVRWCSAVAASCVQIAFYDGCAAAAAARRRELRI